MLSKLSYTAAFLASLVVADDAIATNLAAEDLTRRSL
jgi:hypothetical protein